MVLVVSMPVRSVARRVEQSINDVNVRFSGASVPDAQDQSLEWFEILVRENSRSLLAYIQSCVHDAATADDIWQETMLVAWRRVKDFDRERTFGAWLRGIASRIILSHSRKTSRVSVIDPTTIEFLDRRFETLDSAPGDTLDEKLLALRHCVQSLPEHYRDCIQMRFRDDLQPKELSQRLGLALETVKKRLNRAKRMLVECFDRKLAGHRDQEQYA